MATTSDTPGSARDDEHHHEPGSRSYAEALNNHQNDDNDHDGRLNGSSGDGSDGDRARQMNGGDGGDGALSHGDHRNGGPGPHMAAVLRITDTGAGATASTPASTNGTGAAAAAAAAAAVNGHGVSMQRPEFDRQESKREYSAEGIDDTPKSPPRYRHRKAAQSKDNGRKNGQHITIAVDNRTPQLQRSSSDLTSIRPSPDYDKQLYTDKLERRDSDLVSGRRAGQRWHESGMRFAPWNVPLQRRLQTAAVLIHTLTIGLLVSSFFFLCAIPLLWPILIPYLVYVMQSQAATSGELSHRLEWLRRSPFWSLFASYFPARLHRSQELPATRKYIFGYHPHGIISIGAWMAFATEALGFAQLFPGIKNTLLTLDSNFRIPLQRDYALAMGLASVSKESCENLLTKGGPDKEGMGRAITIVIGGASESLDAQPYTMRLVLKKRKGFVKMAIRTGADLVPVLAFGENDMYDQLTPDAHPRIHRFQLLVKRILGFTIPLFHARGVFNYDVGLMPYRRPINIVVGRPVMVVKCAEPRQEDIDHVHAEYVKELERLWDTYKDEFAPRRQAELEIVE